MSTGPWSPDEDERLRNLARSGFSLTEIALELQRRKSSVHGRATRLKIAMARDRNATPITRQVELGLKVKGK
jgi:hypothetical protein